YRLSTAGTERHWMLRAKSNLKFKVVRKLGRGDQLVEFAASRKSRKEHPEMPEVFQARLLDYHVKGFRPQKLITSMVDAEKYPAKEVVELYHERWELEVGYDEIKTHMLEREEALRSKKPDGVRQEVAGICLAYNLVRVEMARVAKELGLPVAR